MLSQGTPSDSAMASICTVNHNRVSLEFIGSQRTDGVHCRESAGTGPEVLRVIPVRGVMVDVALTGISI